MRSIGCNQMKLECNQHEVLDVIHRRWYVINPKMVKCKSCDLMTYSSHSELITYQSFGLDKKRTKQSLRSFWLPCWT